MFTIIITACYTSSIIAFVTLPIFPETVDSITGLLSGFYRVGTLGKILREIDAIIETVDIVLILYRKRRMAILVSKLKPCTNIETDQKSGICC